MKIERIEELMATRKKAIDYASAIRRLRLVCDRAINRADPIVLEIRPENTHSVTPEMLLLSDHDDITRIQRCLEAIASDWDAVAGDAVNTLETETRP